MLNILKSLTRILLRIVFAFLVGSCTPHACRAHMILVVALVTMTKNKGGAYNQGWLNVFGGLKQKLIILLYIQNYY